MAGEKLSADQIITRSGWTVHYQVKKRQEKIMELEVGKFYITGDGDKIEVLKADRPAWLAVICYNHTHECLWPCQINGQFFSDGKSKKHDIIGPWVEEPVIHWDELPKSVEKFEVGENGLRDILDVSVFAYTKYDNEVFPDWRNFIGETFTRPEGE